MIGTKRYLMGSLMRFAKLFAVTLTLSRAVLAA